MVRFSRCNIKLFAITCPFTVSVSAVSNAITKMGADPIELNDCIYANANANSNIQNTTMHSYPF